MDYFYQKSNIINFTSNVKFDDILNYTPNELNNWISLLKEEIIEQWDIQGIPPVIGKNTEDIIQDFNGLKNYNVDKLIIESDDDLIIKNKTKTGMSVNQFFPTMMKTKISTGVKSDNGKSIYDYFSSPSLSESFKKTMIRGIRKDSMYNFSVSLTTDDFNGSGVDYVRNFDVNGDKGFWICKSKSLTPNPEYVTLTPQEIKDLFSEGLLSYRNVSNLDLNDLQSTFSTKNGKEYIWEYLIRVYDKNTKIFPSGLQIFRMSLSQVVVNFNPITAKTLYTNFTNHIEGDEPIFIYDPSSGWGGRLLGSLSMNKKTHYIGTDPNEELFISDLNKTRYEYLGEFFNEHTSSSNTYDIFRDGSEIIGENIKFQKYKNQIDFIFTSPPYFNREQYTQSETQSFKKFTTPQSWIDGFLRPTLTTCYEYLKNDRFLCWNISNIKVGSKIINLEEPTIQILTELGMEYQGKIKMLMTTMKGLNPEDVENSVFFEGKYQKYEPIFVFYKK